MEDQQVGAEGRLERMDDAEFKQRFGAAYALLDEEEDKVSYALKSDPKTSISTSGNTSSSPGFWWKATLLGLKTPVTSASCGSTKPTTPIRAESKRWTSCAR